MLLVIAACAETCWHGQHCTDQLWDGRGAQPTLQSKPKENSVCAGALWYRTGEDVTAPSPRERSDPWCEREMQSRDLVASSTVALQCLQPALSALG